MKVYRYVQNTSPAYSWIETTMDDLLSSFEYFLKNGYEYGCSENKKTISITFFGKEKENYVIFSIVK